MQNFEQNNKPLVSPELIEKRKNIHLIVAAYCGRHEDTIAQLISNQIISGDIRPIDLLDMLLHDVDLGIITLISKTAGTYINTLGETKRLDLLTRASL